MNPTTTNSSTTKETAQQLGLLPDEYDRICELMGRKPNFTELSIFSVMWSEHCCYKNSIIWLKTLPKKGERLLAEAGEENAGLVDIGDGLACAFKIESHNHPSAIEPYQGAATGVGGIHRDIFTMGARPVAAMNSLRFGDLKLNKTKHLLKGVVKGIGDYGNSFGVPTVGGEIYFDNCYNTNPLVNAMSVGIVKSDGTVSAKSEGVGNPVYIVGSATGKDGIHGATFASEDITEESSEKLPAVQVGDPFQEKKLLEATLELIPTGAVIGMQDMGAAGITCSTSEMSAKTGCGMKVYLDKVPTRQENMQPFEILLSESQERMLIVVEKGREKEVEAIFDKWDLNCAIIGEVTESGLEYYMNGELVAEVNAEALALGGDTPVYERPYNQPAYISKLNEFKIEDVKIPDNLQETGEKILALPNIASKRWVYEQYDYMVGIDNISSHELSDAALIRIKGTEKALAISTDCNSRYVYADPYKGAAIAVSEAARNIVCSGGEPVAITNCLNFGNPYDPAVYWQFVMAIKGMSDACEKHGTPVTGGNVSFYNQSPDGGAVFPTPVIGVLGILDHVDMKLNLHFRKAGDKIYMLGESREDIGSSEYLYNIIGIKSSPAPHFDLDEESRLQQTVSMLNKNKLIRSAHDISDGGLWTCLTEAGIPSGLGFDIKTDDQIRKDAFLFGESQSRVVVSVKAEATEAFEKEMNSSGFPYKELGRVTGGDISVDGEKWKDIKLLKKIYHEAIEKLLEG